MPPRKRLLDLFCGAGGASVGYYQAGFEVVGVDIKPQPHYPFEFHRLDALDFPLELMRTFDAIHASPPCQAYSVANNIWGHDHPELIEPTRDRLLAAGKPYIIENVPKAPLVDPLLICGLAIGCNVKRHRHFETNFTCFGTQCPPGHPGNWLLVFGHTTMRRGTTLFRTPTGPRIRRKHVGASRGRYAMGISWMDRDELSEAIPPAYTKLIGDQLLALVT